MRNADRFGTFATQILSLLYDDFPIPISLPRQQMTDLLAKFDDLCSIKREASTVEGITELLEAAGQLTPERKEGGRLKIAMLKEKVNAQSKVIKSLEDIFDGTVFFLEQEGFIRTSADDLYQLTLKGFTHLNKRFEQGAIQGEMTLVQNLREALSKQQFAGSLSSGVLVALLTKILS